MKPPPFVKLVPDERGRPIWTLAGDTGTTPWIEDQKSLRWDETFLPCVDALIDAFGEPSGIVIDVGAFIGDSTAWFSHSWEVLTFEPQRDAFLCLLQNIPAGFHLPFPCGNGELVDLESGEGGNMGARQARTGGMIRTMRIDDFHLDDVRFIKIDAEGWEHFVLSGAVETIIRCKPLIRVEYNLPALERLGMNANHINMFFEGWQGREVYRYNEEQWDMLWIPR